MNINREKRANDMLGVVTAVTNPVTGGIEFTAGGEAVELGGGSGPKVWRGMGQGMGINVQGMNGGAGGWSRTTRTRHNSNAAFRRCRVVLATAYPQGSPLVDTGFTEDYDFQVGFELGYTNALTGIAPRRMFKFSDSPVANYRIASPPTNNLIVSDVLDLGRKVTTKEFFGLWTTAEATAKSGDNKCPYHRNGSNFIQRYLGVQSASGVSQIALEAAEKATSITGMTTAQAGASVYYTPAMLLIETDSGIEVVLIDGASNSRGTGEGGSGSGSFGDTVGSAEGDMGFVARGIAALGWNYVTVATGSDSVKERMTSSNWSMRLALAKLANPTKWWCGLGRGDMGNIGAGDYVISHAIGVTYTKPHAVMLSGNYYILLKAGSGVTTVAPSGTGNTIVCGDYVWAWAGVDLGGVGAKGLPFVIARLMRYVEMVLAEMPNVPMTWHVMSTGTSSPSDTTTNPGVQIGLWTTSQGQVLQTGISEANSRRSLVNTFVINDKSLLNFGATVSINDIIEDPATQKWVTDGVTPYLLTPDGAHYNSATCARAAALITKDSFPV